MRPTKQSSAGDPSFPQRVLVLLIFHTFSEGRNVLMKASIKLAVIGAVALMGGAANAAVITNNVTAAGGSDLVLLLKDSTTGTFFSQDLGVQTGTLRSQSQLQADGTGVYSLDNGTAPGAIAPASLNGFTSANLTAYLSGHASDSIQWTIMGAVQGAGTLAQGIQTFAVASTTDQFNAYWDSASVSASRASLATLFASINTNVAANGVSTSFGYGDSTTGKNAPISFQDASHSNGTALGSAQTLYLMATGGAGLGANTYASQYTLTLSSAGVLSYDAPSTAPVPVPAAIWLLGSGLMGLVGIGRRRNAASLAA
jgi:hypothetical protein